jgi:hypothetical protein
MPKYMLTGFSAGSFGAQWQITPSDRDIAVDVIDELENRRILWELSPRERQFLGTLMRTQGIGKELKMELKTMQAHFRQFMTNLSAYDLNRRGPVDPQSLVRVLGWLREPVGQQVGFLAAQYGIEVSDNLSKIVPNQNDWFFEQI